MDQRSARLRINFAQREFEVEGSETFVRTYAERFDLLLDRINLLLDAAPPAATEGRADARPPAPQSFGELLQQLPRSATDVDRVLVAGYFAQVRSPDSAFATGDANTLLTEQGVKVGNPSQCVKQNLLAKRVFKHQGRYRVSQNGVEYLRQLLGARLPE